MIDFEQWEGFEGRIWKEEVNVRDFIQKNYTPYDGDESFLAGPTEATNQLWGALQKLQKEERAKGGVLDMETEVVSSLTSYGPGYIDESLKDLEQIVGLQTDKPLKRAFMPYGGIKMAEQACTTYGYQPSEELHKIFTDYTRTHNQAVFDAYTPEMKKARHTHIITGLPDTYGRGRIVGDYRRVALYGIDALAVGISLAMVGQVNIFFAAPLIGLCTCLLSAIGVKVGNVFGSRFEKKAQIAGGVILIFILSFILLSNKTGEFPQTSYFRTTFLKFFLPLLTTIPSPES
mgnify:CR=1 FL=1